MSDNKMAPKVVQAPGSDSKKTSQKKAGGGGGGGDKIINPLEVGKVGKDVAGAVVSEVREVADEMTRVVTFENVVGQLFGQPGAAVKTEQMAVSEQSEAWKKRFAQEKVMHKETLQLVERRRKEQKVRIQSVRQEIKVLSTSVAKWSAEVDRAVFEAPVDEGVYHESFFEKLLSFIKSLKARIDSSSHWVAMHNTRSVKKGVFWANAMKGGKLNQKYAFSGERKAAWK
jgi:hypothetical protein